MRAVGMKAVLATTVAGGLLVGCSSSSPPISPPAPCSPPPLEIPVGALTALVGGPYLLWLLGRRAGTR